MLGLLVPEHDAENVVFDNFLDALRDAAEELFAVKDGCDFAAHFVEQSERIGLFRVRKEQALRDGIGVTQQGESSEFWKVIHDGRTKLSLYLM
jgi:hypothetical protein